MHLADSAELLKTAALFPESLSDGELMSLLSERVASPQHEALFTEFYRRFHPKVSAWCFRLSRDRTSVHDLTQEIFIKAWRHLSKFRGDSRPSTWLYVITRNHCLSAGGRLASDPLESSAQLPERLRDTSLPHPDRQIEQSQLCRDVCELMNSTLNPMEVRVLTLHYGYEIPLGAITKRMALVNPSGSKAYIVNGQRKLKGALKRRASLPGAQAFAGTIPRGKTA
jgi:RNA polymerase sigma factor (sigma-70 family)